ncbi:MAG: hypothetical protein ABIH38_02945 [Patescibacteria group bacterium]
MMRKIIKNQKGVTLFLSLLIMSTVVAVAIGVSVLIINQHEYSTNVDHSILAFYAAETGLEAKLAVIKTNRDALAETLSSTVTDMDGSSLLSFEGTNLGNWQTTASPSEKYALSHLKMNEKITIDLFDPNALSGGGGVESIKINWRDNCLGQGVVAGSGWLKLSYVSLANTGGFDATTNPYENIYPCALSNYACTERNNTTFLAGNYYRLIITPLYCDIDYLKVSAFSNDSASAGAEKDISNRISLKSTGTYENSKIALSASIPWILPSQGIFDFVLFSEEIIEKK